MEFGMGTLHGGLEGRRYRVQNCKHTGPAPEPNAAFRPPCTPFMHEPRRGKNEPWRGKNPLEKARRIWYHGAVSAP